MAAFVGDSWTYNNLITGPLRDSLVASYGDAGIGWVSPANPTYYTGATVNRTGTWTDTADTTALGPDYAHFTSTDTATPAATTVTATATKFVIHYVKQPNGGDFTYSIDGGAATTVQTANATTTLATVAVDGLTDESHELALTVSVAGSAGVTLAGVDIQRERGGVRLHKLGRGGTTADGWAALNSTAFAANMTALAPKVTFVLLGVNDLLNDRDPLVFNDAIWTVVKRLQAIGSDVVLVAPAVTGASEAYGQDVYAGIMSGIAAQHGCGYIDLADSVPSYATDATKWTNSTHINADGGQLAADAIRSYLDGL